MERVICAGLKAGRSWGGCGPTPRMACACWSSASAARALCLCSSLNAGKLACAAAPATPRRCRTLPLTSCTLAWRDCDVDPVHSVDRKRVLRPSLHAGLA
eukprot:1667662-Prymnesium_polylepis.2